MEKYMIIARRLWLLDFT